LPLGRASFRQPSERQVSVDRTLNNQSTMQLLTSKLKTEDRDKTIFFLESLGCSEWDIETVLDNVP
jgi:hypothetical protein